MGRLLRYVDWVLILGVLALLSMGILMIGGSTADSWNSMFASSFVRRQATFGIVGLVAMFIVMSVDYRHLRSFSRLFYAATVLLLGAVIMYGETVGGATRWLSVGSQRFQPAEIARVLVIITLANQVTALGKERRRDYTWVDFGWSVVHVAVPAALVLIQPDLGTALVFMAVLLGEIYLAGFSGWRLTAVTFTLGGASLGVLMAHLRYGLEIPFLKPYMVTRLISFVDPTADPTGTGYHLKQSIMAIGSGRVTGNGLFRGAGTQLHFLPEQHTDFIFSALGEQLGFVGAAALLLIFMVVFMRMLTIAAGAADQYGAVIVGGVVAMLFFRVVINIGMTMGIMPITGLPLPFVSYGGTALVSDLVTVGLVLNVGMRRQKILF